MRIAIAASCLLVAGTAAAAPQAPSLPPPLPKLFVSPVGEPFRAAAPADDPVAAWFGQADGDRNGALSRAEIEADAARFFATLDRNHDGEIDPDELTRYERDVAPEIQLGGQVAPLAFGRRERTKKVRDDGLQGAGRFSWLNIPEPVAAADADLNRGVSRAELVRAAGERFDRLDADHDGAITRAELPLLPEQRSDAEKKQARKKPRKSEGIPIPLD